MPAAPAAGPRVKVWDGPTRAFHWLLVALVAANVVTGFLTPEWWLGVHNWVGYSLVALMIFRWLTILLLIMISAHIAGVATESVLTHDNLVGAIITGWKQLPPAVSVATPPPARPVLAAVLFVVVTGIAGATLDGVSRRPPPLSLRALPSNATYDNRHRPFARISSRHHF